MSEKTIKHRLQALADKELGSDDGPILFPCLNRGLAMMDHSTKY